MRVILPYVPGSLRPETLAAVKRWRPERVDVSSDDEAYWRLLRDLWYSGDDFCLVEHDNVPAPGVLAQIERCPRGWCGEAYRLPWGLVDGYGAWHGVTRYRATFTARYSDVPDRIRDRRWPTLDSAWINNLRLLGEQEAHWHWPPARHLHAEHGDDVPSLGSEVKIMNCRCGVPLGGLDPLTGNRTCAACGTFYPVVPRTITAPVY